MKRGINKKNNNSYKQNIKKSRILRNIIITVAIILLIGALFISYKGITGNVVGDESGVYTGDSVGVYMAPTSQFYLKNNLNDLDGIIKIFSFNKLHYPKDMTWCTNDFKKDFGTCFFKPQNNNNCRFIKPVDKEFTYAGMSYKSQIPLMGDWDGDGIDSAGIYNVIDGEFILKNSNTAGKGDLKFKYGKKALEQFSKDYKDVYGRIKYYPYALQYPLVGDWDGDGVDSIGLYDPYNSTFYLKNSNSEGEADIIFKFGYEGFYGYSQFYDEIGYQSGIGYLCPKNRSYRSFSVIPIVGDWDGDGIDSVGIYKSIGRYRENQFPNYESFSDSASKYKLEMLYKSYLDYTGVYLTNEFIDNLNPNLTTAFEQFYSKPNLPLIGDWDGDGADEIGIYDIDEFIFKNDYEIADLVNIKNNKSQFSKKILNIINSVDEYNVRYYGRNLFPISGNWNSKKPKTRCVPNCINPDGTKKECGDNGCGGFCGDFGKCGDDKFCIDSKCVNCPIITCTEIGRECGGPWSTGCGNVTSCGSCEDKPNHICQTSTGKCINVGEPKNILAGLKPKKGTGPYMQTIGFHLNKKYDIYNLSFQTSCKGNKCGCITKLDNTKTRNYADHSTYSTRHFCNKNGKCFFDIFNKSTRYDLEVDDRTYTRYRVEETNVAKGVNEIYTYCTSISNYKAFGTPSIE